MAPVGMSNGHMNGTTATTTTTTRHAAHDSALDVGSKEDEDTRMRDLEEENEMLVERVTAAAQRFADYENEIRVLQAQLRQQQRRNAAAAATEQNNDTAAPTPPPPIGLSRFGSFMGRKPASPAPAANGTTAPSIPSAREQELETALTKERNARLAAEQKVQDASIEIEELSTTLFQQANEMVATERKEAASLRERLKSLENSAANSGTAMKHENERLRQKVTMLEQRDTERKRRLERLEAAHKRIERVKATLLPP